MALSVSSWTSLFSKLAALAEELAPIIESLEPQQAQKVTAAGLTVITTLAGALANTAPNTAP